MPCLDRWISQMRAHLGSAFAVERVGRPSASSAHRVVVADFTWRFVATVGDGSGSGTGAIVGEGRGAGVCSVVGEGDADGAALAPATAPSSAPDDTRTVAPADAPKLTINRVMTSVTPATDPDGLPLPMYTPGFLRYPGEYATDDHTCAHTHGDCRNRGQGKAPATALRRRLGRPPIDFLQLSGLVCWR